jgi:hypothetical protein
MADKQNDDIGRYARHPLRTAGSAFLVGTAIGAGLVASKARREHNKNPLKKFMDQVSH